MSTGLLLEIGCEEIPDRLVESAQDQLVDLLRSSLAERRLSGKGAPRGWATPRRIAAYFPEVLPKQPDVVEEISGPPWQAAFTEDGKPTKAAQGFAAKHGVSVARLKRVQTDKGDYVGVTVRKRGGRAEEILPEIIVEAVRRIEFPRKMRWTSDRQTSFIRPVRWIVALYGARVLHVSYGDVKAGKASLGPRSASGRPVAIRHAKDYESALRRCGVLAQRQERRRKVESEIRRAAGRSGLQVIADPDLVEQVTNMTEQPSAFRGDFSEEFLKLPAEVLTTVMRHHQKYFSLKKRNGALSSQFIAIIDRPPDKRGIIRQGHEAVLEARLRDARFFWKADQAHTLAQRATDLQRVTFHSKLGNYGDKVARVAKLARWIGENSEHGCRHADRKKSGDDQRRRADIDTCERAAELCKSDLTSQLVGEFPELQGIVGGLYARVQGESEDVAAAIYQHYLPSGVTGELPSTPEAVCLSLADKLDTVAGCFEVGDEPTGSRDPYGLRRAANGVVRVIIETGVNLDFEAALDFALKNVGMPTASGGDGARNRLLQFFRERVAHYFREVAGNAYDEINACLEAGWADLLDLAARLHATRTIRPTPNFEPLAAAFKRIRNILQQAGGHGQFEGVVPSVERMEPGAERELFDAYLRTAEAVEAMRRRKEYAEALQAIAAMRPAVDRFFDKVLVNAPDEGVRRNRLVLLASLLREFSSIADFSQIVVAESSDTRR